MKFELRKKVGDEVLDKAVARDEAEDAVADQEAIRRFIRRMGNRGLTDEERLMVGDAEANARSRIRDEDLRQDAMVRAPIFDAFWAQSLEMFHDKHLPKVLDHLVEIYTANELCVLGVVQKVDAGYIEVLTDGKRTVFVSWAAGPVIKVIEPPAV
jgi:hypothetical protein